MAAFLVLLLLILTFNAYACVLPLQTVTQRDCSSDTDDQARQPCDAFLEIGPKSQPSPTYAISSFNHECAMSIQFSDAFVPVCEWTSPPRGVDTPIHVSIPTTVLRI